MRKATDNPVEKASAKAGKAAAKRGASAAGIARAQGKAAVKAAAALQAATAAKAAKAAAAEKAAAAKAAASDPALQAAAAKAVTKAAAAKAAVAKASAVYSYSGPVPTSDVALAAIADRWAALILLTDKSNAAAKGRAAKAVADQCDASAIACRMAATAEGRIALMALGRVPLSSNGKALLANSDTDRAALQAWQRTRSSLMSNAAARVTVADSSVTLDQVDAIDTAVYVIEGRGNAWHYAPPTAGSRTREGREAVLVEAALEADGKAAKASTDSARNHFGGIAKGAAVIRNAAAKADGAAEVSLGQAFAKGAAGLQRIAEQRYDAPGYNPNPTKRDGGTRILREASLETLLSEEMNVGKATAEGPIDTAGRSWEAIGSDREYLLTAAGRTAYRSAFVDALQNGAAALRGKAGVAIKRAALQAFGPEASAKPKRCDYSAGKEGKAAFREALQAYREAIASAEAYREAKAAAAIAAAFKASAAVKAATDSVTDAREALQAAKAGHAKAKCDCASCPALRKALQAARQTLATAEKAAAVLEAKAAAFRLLATGRPSFATLLWVTATVSHGNADPASDEGIRSATASQDWAAAMEWLGLPMGAKSNSAEYAALQRFAQKAAAAALQAVAADRGTGNAVTVGGNAAGLVRYWQACSNGLPTYVAPVRPLPIDAVPIRKGSQLVDLRKVTPYYGNVCKAAGMRFILPDAAAPFGQGYRIVDGRSADHLRYRIAVAYELAAAGISWQNAMGADNLAAAPTFNWGYKQA